MSDSCRTPLVQANVSNYTDRGADFHGSSKTCRTYPLSHHHQPWPPPREAELLAEDFFSSIFIDWVSARGSNFVTFPAPGAATTGFPAFIPFDTGMRVGAGLGDDPSCPVCKRERRREMTWTEDVFFSYMLILYFSLILLLPLKQPCPKWHLLANKVHIWNLAAAHTARVGPKVQLGSKEFPRAEVQCFGSRCHRDGKPCKTPSPRHDRMQDGLRGYWNTGLAVRPVKY